MPSAPQPALAAPRRQDHGLCVEEELGSETRPNDELPCTLIVDAQHRYTIFAGHTRINDGLLLLRSVFGTGKLSLHAMQAEAVVHALLEHASRALLSVDHRHVSRARTSRAHRRRHARSAAADDDHIVAVLDPCAPARLSLPRARFRMLPARLRARLVRLAQGPARNSGLARANQLDIVGAS